jgi:hypothetical protein
MLEFWSAARKTSVFDDVATSARRPPPLANMTSETYVAMTWKGDANGKKGDANGKKGVQAMGGKAKVWTLLLRSEK